MSSGNGLTVDLDVTGKAWGTRFDWGCEYSGRDWGTGSTVMYDLVVVRVDGTTQTVASWTAAGADARGLSASTDIPRDQIASVQVRLRGQAGPLAGVDL